MTPVNSSPDVLTRPTTGSHFVFFYEHEEVLYDQVAQFLGAGLSQSEPALVIATPEHRLAVRAKLEAKSFDIERALGAGQLTMVDARETLEALMVGGSLDPERVADVLGGLLDRMVQRRPGTCVHVYGEMVDLLCRAGESEVAIRLEHMWNELAKRHSFALLCAYGMDSFASSAGAKAYASVCGAHTHAFPADSPNGIHARLRIISELEQRARVLEADIERHREADSFRLLVESVTDYSIFMLDPRGVITTWNAGARRTKGYAPHEIIGKHFSIFYPPQEVASGKCEYELEVASETGRFEDEGFRIRKDGSRFWANVIITALRDTNGVLVGFAKVTRDLTERREAEEERLRLARSLEANRVKDEFLAVISHELRTPLNAILGWATMLKSRTTDPYVAKAVTTIVRNAQAQSRLIDDVLDMSRIIAGKLRLELNSADLSVIVRDAVEVVRPAAVAKEITLHVDLSDEPMMLVGDATRLQQVAWNLLSNAVKFTEKGGSVHVHLENGGASICLAVRDTGRGIEPDFLPHVFERFSQADGSATRRTSGLGLGLSIVRHIVELHGGTAEARSEGTGKGSTFTIKLPVRAVAPAESSCADQAKGSAENLRLEGISVLVVDDEADARELVAAMLESRGATVTLAESASEALAKLSAERPEVIVSDIGMPGEDGHAFARSVRALPRGDEISMVALTAYASAQDRRRAFDAGFNNHIPKPIDAEELASVVRNLVNFARR